MTVLSLTQPNTDLRSEHGEYSQCNQGCVSSGKAMKLKDENVLYASS